MTAILPGFEPNLDSHRALVSDGFHDYADRLRVAESWIERFVSIQKL